MIKYKNTKSVSKDDFKKLKSLAKFVLNKFFSDEKQKEILINVEFYDDLFENKKQWGNCIWEDEHYKPNEFTIWIDPKQKISLLLNTLAHELVHVKQWAKGEFYQLQSDKYVYKFNGKRIDTKQVDYWDTPWEIEAHGRAIGLVVQWAKKNNLADDKLVTEG